MTQQSLPPEPYELTDRDTVRYLKTRKPGDPIGRCKDPVGCLLVQAARYKYPDLPLEVVTAEAGDITFYYRKEGALAGLAKCSHAMTRLQRVLVNIFDDEMGKAILAPITLGEFARVLQQKNKKLFDRLFPRGLPQEE